MINAVIVEDEAIYMEYLESKLKQFAPEVNIIARATSGKEALTLLPKMTIDLLLLDIELGDMSAFDLLEKLKIHDYPIIFTTSFEQYAVKAFKANAIDYLLKPVEGEELRNAINKAKAKILTPERIVGLLSDYRFYKSKSILISEKTEYSLISIDSILYCEADGNYTNIHYELPGKEDVKISTKTLKYFDNKLSEFNFIRISQSVLVNGEKVKKIVKRNNQLILHNGTTFTIAKRRKTDVIEQLSNITSR